MHSPAQRILGPGGRPGQPKSVPGLSQRRFRFGEIPSALASEGEQEKRPRAIPATARLRPQPCRASQQGLRHASISPVQVQAAQLRRRVGELGACPALLGLLQRFPEDGHRFPGPPCLGEEGAHRDGAQGAPRAIRAGALHARRAGGDRSGSRLLARENGRVEVRALSRAVGGRPGPSRAGAAGTGGRASRRPRANRAPAPGSPRDTDPRTSP